MEYTQEILIVVVNSMSEESIHSRLKYVLEMHSILKTEDSRNEVQFYSLVSFLKGVLSGDTLKDIAHLHSVMHTYEVGKNITKSMN